MDAESWVAVDEYEKHLQKNVVEWLKEFPPAELGVGTDTISRQAAIDALDCINGTEEVLRSLPPAQPDLSDYSDKLWRNAYERGKAEAQPEPQEGEWIPVHPLQGDDPGAYMCSKCKTGMWEIRPSAYHYCPNCGTHMRGEKDG